jgi:hypothetical protein
MNSPKTATRKQPAATLTRKEQQKQQTQESNQREIARNNPKIDNNVVRGYN